MTVQVPQITDSVVQSFFIEALGGSQNPISYLDRFPDSVYSKAFDSVLVKFMYALLGPVGVGALRQEYLKARLQFEAAGLQTADLDALYTNAFAFARLAEEAYQLDASSSLLPSSERAQILLADASFRNRAIAFLQGARAGGTPPGLSLVARSGLNRPAEVVEAYQSMYDHYSDRPLGLSTVGVTNSPNEVIIIPRQPVPQSAVQTLTFSGVPTQGWFTLSYPTAQNWIAVPISVTRGSSTIGIPNAGLFPPGVFVTLTTLPTNSTQLDPTQGGWNFASLYAMCGSSSGTTAQLVYPPSAGSQAGQPAPAPTTGNFIALVGVGQTIPIAFNATAAVIQNALMALPGIGLGNVVITGGPLPANSLNIQFAHKLSDQPVAPLLVNLGPDNAVGITATGTGGTEQLSDLLHNPLTISGLITQSTVGSGGDGQVTTIAPDDEHAMRVAVRETMPMTTLITVQDGDATAVRQEPNASFTASSRVAVERYVTGRAGVQWPELDETHWIEANLEHEGPRALGGGSQHYQGFHNVVAANAYTELAVFNAFYGPGTLNWLSYWDSNIGTFSALQQLLVPGLAQFTDPAAQYLPINAVAGQPEPLILANVGGQTVINDIYPSDYLSLPGVPQPPSPSMWASNERLSGTDYLEIDLGAPQAVNYIYFEATRKPFTIDVAYDVLDQAPARRFVPITAAPSSSGSSVLALNYDHAMTNMWTPVEISCTNGLGAMIYTRFLRIGFTRDPGGTPFAPLQGNAVPYSIEVRNLRVGRNVSTPDAGQVRWTRTA